MRSTTSLGTPIPFTFIAASSKLRALQVLLHFVSLPPVVYVPLAFLMGLYGPWAMKKAWRKLRH